MHSQLPIKYCFINKFDTNYIDKQDKLTAIIYRNYTAIVDLNTIIEIKNYCKKKQKNFNPSFYKNRSDAIIIPSQLASAMVSGGL